MSKTQADNDQCSQSTVSIDSSALLSESQSTQSLQIPLSNHANIKKQIESDNHDSVEKARINEQNRISDLFIGFQQPFVGFVGGGKGKKIEINSSRLKRARDLLSSAKKLESEHSTSFQFSQSCSLESSTAEMQNTLNQFPQFTLGFTAVGTGAKIEVSEESNARVKEMFQELSQTRKSTRLKCLQLSKQKQKESEKHHLKTVQPEWKNKSIINCSKKRPALPRQQQIINAIIIQIPQLKYTKIKLADLPCDFLAEKWSEFEVKWSNFNCLEWEISHAKSGCSEKWCYFCQKFKNQPVTITKDIVIRQIQIMMGSLGDCQSGQLDQIARVVSFKLCKYEHFYPEIFNKKFTPNNLLIQLHKKLQLMERGYYGPLKESLGKVSNKIGGKHINLCIIEWAVSEQAQTIFIELTDGWSIVCAVISSSNALFQIFRGKQKRRLGLKISIVDWNIHPVCNILDFHPDQNHCRGIPCIQFNYNNSMLIPFNEKLGWPSHQFYRPVQKNKENGGLIPLVEGTIIRMFTTKSAKGLASYIEILEQGSAYLMKICLPEQVSLVELFRLYFSYHFLKIKKVGRVLEFSNHSKFYEILDPDRMIKIERVFVERLLNLKQQQLEKYPHFLEEKQCFDIVTSKKQFQVGSIQFWVNQNIEGTVLLQQYHLTRLPGGYLAHKGDKGSYLKRIPKIYDKILYSAF